MDEDQMSKDAYYFSHDSNARNDIKIKALRKKYGIDGYGKYWIIIEFMRESKEYKLPLKQYTYDALAEEFNASSTDVEQFINDCIDAFELFVKDDNYFYSESLLRRMEKLDSKREQAKRAGKISAAKRAEKTQEPPEPEDIQDISSNGNSTTVQRPFNDRSTIKVNKSKVNKSKVKESKDNKYTSEIIELEKYFDTMYKTHANEMYQDYMRKDVDKIHLEWLDTFDKLVRLDKESPETIMAVITDLYTGGLKEFWIDKRNFWTATKFRDKLSKDKHKNYFTHMKHQIYGSNQQSNYSGNPKAKRHMVN